MYNLNASDFQRPRPRICASEMPFSAAKLAAPIRKEGDLYLEQSKSQKARAPLSCRVKTSVLTAEPSARQKGGPEWDPLTRHQRGKNSTGQNCTVESL